MGTKNIRVWVTPRRYIEFNNYLEYWMFITYPFGNSTIELIKEDLDKKLKDLSHQIYSSQAHIDSARGITYIDSFDAYKHYYINLQTQFKQGEIIYGK